MGRPSQRYFILFVANRASAAKVWRISVAARHFEEVRVDHKPSFPFCFCILTLAQFGHFHFRCWW